MCNGIPRHARDYLPRDNALRHRDSRLRECQPSITSSRCISSMSANVRVLPRRMRREASCRCRTSTRCYAPCRYEARVLRSRAIRSRISSSDLHSPAANIVVDPDSSSRTVRSRNGPRSQASIVATRLGVSISMTNLSPARRKLLRPGATFHSSRTESRKGMLEWRPNVRVLPRRAERVAARYRCRATTRC